MAVSARLFLLLLLLPPDTGATRTLPPPSNVRLSVDVERCQLTVSWDPPLSSINDTCTYDSVVWQDENTMQFDSKGPRSVNVELGKEVVFGVKPECSKERLQWPWHNFTLQQKGKPGTGAVNISCIWHNEQYITCSWKAGENATRQDNYNLFYGHVEEPKNNRCTNSSRDGNNFRCTFLPSETVTSHGVTVLWILVKGDSEDVQPMCVNGKNFQTKMHPPSRVKVSKDSNGVILEWTMEADRNALSYQIEIKDTTSNSEDPPTYETSDQTRKSISLKPNAKHRFRVRVIPKGQVGSTGIWSNWSEEAVWDSRENGNTFYILLYIFIPFSVAVLTIIVLVYLKRIKLLILPKIPDPGQVLKKMFEDQSEDLQKHPTYDVIKDEQIHSLMILEPTGNEI